MSLLKASHTLKAFEPRMPSGIIINLELGLQRGRVWHRQLGCLWWLGLLGHHGIVAGHHRVIVEHHVAVVVEYGVIVILPPVLLRLWMHWVEVSSIGSIVVWIL